MRSYHTKEFEKARFALHRAGHRSVANKLNGLLVQLHAGDDAASAHLTKHGESRLANAEKFDLGEGYRLVTQLLEDEGTRARVMWFVGTHDEAELWLERHRGHRYVISPKDKRIELVPVDVPIHASLRIANVELAPAVAEQPLLRHLSSEDWEQLDVSADLKRELLEITHLEFADFRVEDLLARLPPVQRDVVFDVMIASNQGDLDKIQARLELFNGLRKRASVADVIDAIARPVNADQFLTFDDPAELKELLEKESWEEWMLFLHIAQKELVRREFSGPARIRGVSGSGKTSIVIHRARVLGRRYQAPILVVTLTRTLALLIQHLLDQLCGVERDLIQVSTTQALAFDVLDQLAPDRKKSLSGQLGNEQLRAMRAQALKDAGATRSWRPPNVSSVDVERYLDAEMLFIRENYLVGERSQWVRADRRGRGRPLGQEVRERVLDAVFLFEERLAKKRTVDQEGLVMLAMDVAAQHRNVTARFGELHTIRSPFARCVLVDESQDLSLNELRLLQALTEHSAPDAFFVSGDSAQRVHRRYSNLAQVGIEVRGRAYVLKKNYRNTTQILRAARTLLEKFDVNELDDAAEGGRIAVDFPAREGETPTTVRFETSERECDWVASEISRMLQEEHGAIGAGVAVVSPSPSHRQRIAERLIALGVPTTNLRQDIIAASEPVKISTIESAKGHEFSAVFIAGVSSRILPQPSSDDESVKRDAARLYVAMTRARDRLVVTWSREDGGASRFLSAMIGTVNELRWVNGKLRPDQDGEVPSQEPSVSRTRSAPMGRYEFMRQIEGAGMAECYEGRNRDTGETVFVKRVGIGSADARALQREIEVYDRLQYMDCEHVLRVLGVERTPEHVALVTEFADGGDLKTFVAKQPGARLPVNEALSVASEIALGLSELHGAEIVHRDLKPENVLRAGSRWKLADFGIAKNRRQVLPGHTFQQAGTYGYAAPEQFDGVEAHPSADIYSFGKLIVFLLTGVTDIDRIRIELDDLRRLVRRCAATEPAGRPNIDDVIRVLTDLAGDGTS